MSVGDDQERRMSWQEQLTNIAPEHNALTLLFYSWQTHIYSLPVVAPAAATGAVKLLESNERSVSGAKEVQAQPFKIYNVDTSI